MCATSSTRSLLSAIPSGTRSVHDLRAGERFPAFAPESHTDELEHRAAANRAVAVSAIGLALTGGLELLVAVLSGSVGLLGDALHNLSDVSTSAVVFIGFRYSKRHADPTHPYGWDRAEDLAGLAVAAVVWASAVAAGALSVHKLFQHGRTTGVGVGMVMAIIGIIGNQLVARYKRHVGRRIHSASLEADATHSWLDAIASAGAFVGLLGVGLGYWWADPVAGLLVTGFIVHVGWEVTHDLTHRLMDGVDPIVLETAERAARDAGASHAHVRARWAGRSLLIEIEAFIDGAVTISDADELGRRIRAAVRAAVPECRFVLWAPRPMIAG